MQRVGARLAPLYDLLATTMWPELSPRSAMRIGGAGVIDEIIVTAQKRSESVQDVPAAVSAFNEEQLTRTHATQLQDFAAYMPGINVSTSGSPGQTSIT